MEYFLRKPKMTGGDPILDKIKNEFTNPDSDLAKAFDPNKNGVNAGLAKAFDPNLNGLAKALGDGKDTFNNIDWNKIGTDMRDTLDPDKNGIADGIGKAAQTIGQLAEKIAKTSQRNKSALLPGIDAFRNELSNPNSDLAIFFRDVGVDFTENYLESPDMWFDLVSMLIAGAAMVITAPIGGVVAAPIFFAASQAIVQGLKMINKAANGETVGAGDVAGFVLAVIPVSGVATRAVGTQVAKTVAPVVGKDVAKMAGTAVNKKLVAEAQFATAKSTTLVGQMSEVGNASAWTTFKNLGSGFYQAGKRVATSRFTNPARIIAAASIAFTRDVVQPSAPVIPVTEAEKKQERLDALNSLPPGYNGAAGQKQPTREEGIASGKALEAQMQLELVKKANNQPYYDYDRGEFVDPRTDEEKSKSGLTVTGSLGSPPQMGGLVNTTLNPLPPGSNTAAVGQPQLTREQGLAAGTKLEAEMQLELDKKANNQPYYDYDRGEYIDPAVAPQMGGSGKIIGGSSLIDHLSNYTLHKRPRLDYDPSFFI